MANWPDFVDAQEGEVMNRLLSAAFKAGFEVEVWYGDGCGDPDEDLAVPYTTDRAAIQAETAATCITHWKLRWKANQTYAGLLALVHGNCPWEVLNDYAAPDPIALEKLESIFDPVIDKCEEIYA